MENIGQPNIEQPDKTGKPLTSNTAEEHQEPERRRWDKTELEQKARDLDQKAKDEEATKKTKSGLAYENAARAWWDCLQVDPTDAWALSRFLTCGRKARMDLRELIHHSMAFIEQGNRNKWVDSAMAWTWRSLAHECVIRKDIRGATEASAKAMALASELSDPSLLISCIASDLAKIHRTINDSSQFKNKTAQLAQLAQVIDTHSEQFIGNLSDVAEKPRSRRAKSSSALERFFYLCRKVAKQAEDMQLQQKTMSEAIKRFEKNQWFTAAYIEAAADVQTARHRGNEAFAKMPDSWAIAVARANKEIDAGRFEQAQKYLSRACIATPEPWPWKKLADLLLQQDKRNEAAMSMRCALCHQNPKDAGKVWKIHLELARTLFSIGRQDEAIEETWLARQARQSAGWPTGKQLDGFMTEHKVAYSEVFDELDKKPDGAVRKAAIKRYRESLEQFMKEQSRPAVVHNWNKEKGFGFVRLQDGRTAFLHKNTIRGWQAARDQNLNVVVTPSLDRKKGVLGWKVCWAQRDKAVQENT